MSTAVTKFPFTIRNTSPVASGVSENGQPDGQSLGNVMRAILYQTHDMGKTVLPRNRSLHHYLIKQLRLYTAEISVVSIAAVSPSARASATECAPHGILRDPYTILLWIC